MAKDTGRLRNAIRKDLNAQLQAQRGQTKIKLTLSRNRLQQRVPYAKYHWREGPTGLTYYKDPTTPDTAPIKPEKFMSGYVKRFVQYIRPELLKEGLDIR